MIIKPDSRTIITNVALLLLVVAASLLLFVRINSISGAFVIWSVCSGLIFRRWIATGKTITLDANGCTVSFFWYKRRYKWSDFITIKYGDYTKSFGYKSPYMRGIEFSPYRNKRPRWIKPAEYCELFHPISYIYIYFTPAVFSKENLRYPLGASVDEKEFRCLMEKWGVIIAER